MAVNPEPTRPATDRTDGADTDTDTIPADGSENVGPASYEEVPRPATNLIYAAVLAVVVIVVLALIFSLTR